MSEVMCIHQAFARLNVWFDKKQAAGQQLDRSALDGYCHIPSDGRRSMQALLQWGGKFSEVVEVPAIDQKQKEWLSQPGHFGNLDEPSRRFRFNQKGGSFEVLEFPDGSVRVDVL